MSTRFFRAGVGTVILNQLGQVALFQRKTYPDIWQFQQGGIDHGEIPTETVWRELFEEVGLLKAAITFLGEMPDWISYEDPIALNDPSIERMGQTHKWFFLTLNEGVIIDLTLATDDEFTEWKWVTFEEAITLAPSQKQPVYKKLYDYYETYLK